MVVEAHILSAAMALSGMSTIDSVATNTQYFPIVSEDLAPSERKQILLMAAKSIPDKFVDKFVDLMIHDVPFLANHRDSGHDGVLEYASEVLTLGLLFMEFNDAIRVGDGNRICRCWQFLFLIFKATGRKNYSVDAFVLLPQLNFLFTPRMAAQLKWSRTINTHGRPGRNIACEESISHLGSNVSDKAVIRVGNCLGEITKVTENYDDINGIPSTSGKHVRKSEKEDLTKFLHELNVNRVFYQTLGRKYANFLKFYANPARKLSVEDLKEWMNEKTDTALI